MRRFTIGDIHGSYRGLVQVLERAKFDPKKDLLICLGDVCDGWPETKQAIDHLMTLDNLIYLTGNHDFWFHDYMRGLGVYPEWWQQGGKETFMSFYPEYENPTPRTAWAATQDNPIDKKYLDFFENAKLYHQIDDDKSPDTVFVHGGFNKNYRIEEHSDDFEFTWDRQLLTSAVNQSLETGDKQITQHKRIFVGHTAIKSHVPMKFCEVWAMDTGAGWSGTLSLMDIDTEEYWTSDPSPKLYPNVKGR